MKAKVIVPFLLSPKSASENRLLCQNHFHTFTFNFLCLLRSIKLLWYFLCGETCRSNINCTSTTCTTNVKPCTGCEGTMQNNTIACGIQHHFLLRQVKRQIKVSHVWLFFSTKAPILSLSTSISVSFAINWLLSMLKVAGIGSNPHDPQG